ncbi:MAG TPA: 50S ribosomal protein L18a [Candidatus Poseidoniales archaeon]|nr:50S ribosomal protein L18a [Candidatus Poseidoniales archaeon]
MGCRMDAYRIQGSVPMGREVQVFSIDLVAENNDDATHRIYSIIGSRHKVNRRVVNIESCKKIDPRESKEPQVINHFRELIASSEPLSVNEEE